jgi:hypothetical protein
MNQQHIQRALELGSRIHRLMQLKHHLREQLDPIENIFADLGELDSMQEKELQLLLVHHVVPEKKLHPLQYQKPRARSLCKQHNFHHHQRLRLNQHLQGK